jgi:hypothetical protein
MSFRCYTVFGLTVASEISLPELQDVEAPGEADVHVRRGQIASVADEQSGLTVTGQTAFLFIPGIARYQMVDGRELIVDAEDQASERNVRLYLLGSAFAAILHQRGLLPLHANSIIVAGKAIGFMGHPGAGKSTTAAWFHDQGYEILGDDVCVVTPDPEGPMAHAGIPRLRLWREALEASGRSVDGYEMSFDDWDKYNVPIGEGRGPDRAPLSHLYLLDDAGGSDEPGIDLLTGAAAVEALVANTYRGGYVPMMDQTARHLFACAQLARLVPVYRVRRRWGLEALGGQGEILAAHARSLIG